MASFKVRKKKKKYRLFDTRKGKFIGKIKLSKRMLKKEANKKNKKESWFRYEIVEWSW